MLSIPRVNCLPPLADVAAALSLPTALVVSEGPYQNRKGTEGYYATVLAAGRWYMISVSNSDADLASEAQGEHDADSTAETRFDGSTAPSSLPEDESIGGVGRLFELFSWENKQEAAEFLLDCVTDGFCYPNKDQTEEFLASLLDELDAVASELRKDQGDLVDEIENIETYFPADESVADMVRDNYRLRGLMFHLFQREPSDHVGPRLDGLEFVDGVREMKAILSDVRHFIVRSRRVLREAYFADNRQGG
jgi:hypothetical protein